ncbi:MAG: AAA family ATPase [Acidimicrobiales bacterium]
MTSPPYHYGSPVGPDHFCDRADELAAIVGRMLSATNVILLSPRRYGKTSLLALAAARARARRARIAQVNLLRCASRREVTQAVIDAAAKEILESRRRSVAAWVGRLRVRPSVTVGLDGSLSVRFEPGLADRDWEGTLVDTFALVEERAKVSPVSVVLDEFQHVAEIDPGLPGVFKALADAAPSASLVFAGSHAHLMERLTASPGAPLLDMGEVIRLGPVPEAAMVAYLQERAASAGKVMGDDVAAAIWKKGGPVPNDVQRLAYASFEVAASVIDLASVDAGMHRVVSHQASMYADRFERLAAGHQRILLVLAASPTTQPFSRAFLDSVEMANANGVRKALRALEEQELLVLQDGRRTVADPFLREWLLTP